MKGSVTGQVSCVLPTRFVDVSIKVCDISIEVCPLLTSLLLALLMSTTALGQSVKNKTADASGRERVEAAEVVRRSREDFVKATKEYKASLEQLLRIKENNARKIAESLAQLKTLYAEGLISKRALEEKERELSGAEAQAAEVRQQLATAETQIAGTLLEAEAEEQMAQAPPVPQGKMVRTTSYLRYNGPAAWSLSDAWKVQRFFQERFGRALPISAFGQSGLHNRWRLDHRDAMDVPLNPTGVEGQALMAFLRSSGIPFAAFTGAIPGTATGPHIHVGRPSHRY
ncbi:MAG TPA: hypothetical protein VGC64_08715 [Pyrinomonadaceae bacterium]